MNGGASSALRAAGHVALRATAKVRRATFPWSAGNPKQQNDASMVSRPTAGRRTPLSDFVKRHPAFLLDTLWTPILYGTLLRADRISLGELESSLLPILKEATRTEKGIHVMLRDARFLAWARNTFLRAKYGDSIRELPPVLQEYGAETLPGYTEARAALSINYWPRHKAIDAPGSAERLEVADDAKMRQLWDIYYGWRKIHEGKAFEPHWTLDQFLEFYGCGIQGMSPMNMFCEDRGLYEVFTQEYIMDLASHLAISARSMRRESGRPVRILEVGAGQNGYLSHFLRSELEIVAPSIEFHVTATDSGLWGGKGTPANSYPVENLSYEAALEKHKPHIVLCSWMPRGEDWTNAFRRSDHVSEYILIGEECGCCGHPFLTWGVEDAVSDPVLSRSDAPDDFWASIDIFDFLSRVKDSQIRKSKPSPRLPMSGKPLYARDGYVKREVVGASKWQLSRYDRSFCPPTSKTISFQKQENSVRRSSIQTQMWRGRGKESRRKKAKSAFGSRY